MNPTPAVVRPAAARPGSARTRRAISPSDGVPPNRTDLERATPRRFSRPSADISRRRSRNRSGISARREAINLSVTTDIPTDIPTESDDLPTPELDASALEGTAEAHPLQAGAPVRPDSPTFTELGVRPEIVRALAEVGIERTFAIQELTLPLALAGEDVIGQARTGTGKTLGFGVPLLQRLTPPSELPAANSDGEAVDRTRDVPQALVVVPTRELCVQVAKDIADAGRHLDVRVTAIYGGRAYEPQLTALRKGVDVVVGTPGRLLDLAEQRHLVLGRVSALVLDEADEMLDLGFLPDVEKILRMLPDQRQTMLFSATMPGPIIALARAFLTRPTHIRAEEADQGSIHERTRQLVYRAHAMDKVELLSRVLQARDRSLTMVFARTKRTVQRVADDLAERGFAVAAVHGDLGQGAREQALRAFRSEKVDVLVATDVAARGIDVSGVTHVVNYQCPEDAKTYVHRIGRTGRAGREGVAVTLVDWDEIQRWKLVNDELGLGLDEPAETYSTSAHLFAELGIPEAAAGRLPRAQRTRAGLDAEHLDHEGDHGPRRRHDRARRRSGDEAELPERRPRRSGTRVRSRAGQVVQAGAGISETNETSTVQEPGSAAAQAVEASVRTVAAGPAGDGDGVPAPRRRRRRRAGARRRSNGVEAAPDAAAS